MLLYLTVVVQIAVYPQSTSRCLIVRPRFMVTKVMSQGSVASPEHAKSLVLRILITACPCCHTWTRKLMQTVALPASQIPGEHLRIWEGVREAQRLALAAAKAGVLAKNVDLAARQSLVAEGYGDYFTHRLGHGMV